MVSKIKKLEVIKLMKELEFTESEFNYKNEIIHEADTNFLKTVNAYLLIHPELKKIFDEKINKKIEQMMQKKEQSEKKEEFDDYIKSIEENHETEKNDTEKEYISQDITEDEKIKIDKIKKIYREIVKLTHPDKIKNSKLNSLYLKATDSYDKNDIISLYLISDELSLDTDFLDLDNGEINTRIITLKDRINFLESTYTWKWQHSENPIEKEKIILNYISTQLNS